MWQIISLCVYMTYELRRPQSYDFNIILKFCFSLSSDKSIWSAFRFFINLDSDLPNLEQNPVHDANLTSSFFNHDQSSVFFFNFNWFWINDSQVGISSQKTVWPQDLPFFLGNNFKPFTLRLNYRPIDENSALFVISILPPQLPYHISNIATLQG